MRDRCPRRGDCGEEPDCCTSAEAGRQRWYVPWPLFFQPCFYTAVVQFVRACMLAYEQGLSEGLRTEPRDGTGGRKAERIELMLILPSSDGEPGVTVFSERESQTS